MMTVNISGLLLELSDDAFCRVKTKFQSHKNVFITSKDHPIAAQLVDVLCDDKIMASLDRTLFGQMVHSLYFEWTFEMKNLSRYCDLLVKTLGNVQQNTSKDSRANKYANHLINTMIPEFKKDLQSTQKAQSFSRPLSLIYKITACLQYCTAHNRYPFSLLVDLDMLVELEQRVYKQPGNIIGFGIERSYTLLISWIMEEIICAQDGIEVE